VARRMTIISRENCGICGEALIHGTSSAAMNCACCGGRFEALISCPGGHYVCDSCHQQDAVSIIDTVLGASASSSPHRLLEMLMAHPSVPMHGPEHHVFVPCVLIAAARNAGYPVPGNALKEAVRRGSGVPGGWCGSHGVCGAAVGIGIAVSIMTGATPVKGRERALADSATAAALREVADGHPRCCKRAGRLALSAGIAFLEEHLGISLPDEPVDACRFHRRNAECPVYECRYYGAAS